MPAPHVSFEFLGEVLHDLAFSAPLLSGADELAEEVGVQLAEEGEGPFVEVDLAVLDEQFLGHFFFVPRLKVFSGCHNGQVVDVVRVETHLVPEVTHHQIPLFPNRLVAELEELLLLVHVHGVEYLVRVGRSKEDADAVEPLGFEDEVGQSH